MAPIPLDTSPEAQRVLTGLYRRMTPAAKLERVRELTLAANGLALARLRDSYPQDDEGTLLLRLARRRLGDEVIDRTYARPARADDS